jgi:hypothetical protein
MTMTMGNSSLLSTQDDTRSLAVPLPTKRVDACVIASLDRLNSSE